MGPDFVSGEEDDGYREEIMEGSSSGVAFDCLGALWTQGFRSQEFG